MVNKWKNKTHLGPEGEGKHNLLIPEFKSAACLSTILNWKVWNKQEQGKQDG